MEGNKPLFFYWKETDFAFLTKITNPVFGENLKFSGKLFKVNRKQRGRIEISL